MKLLVKKILNWGIDPNCNSLERSRIIFFNSFLLFCIAIAILLCVVNLSFSLWSQFFIGLAGFFIFSLLLILNRQGLMEITKYLLSISTTSLIVIGTFINLDKGYYIELENLLIPVVIITTFVIDGKRMHFSFWLILFVFMWLKVESFQDETISNGPHFTLVLIIAFIVGLITFIFALAFKSSLFKAFEHSEKAEQRLFLMINNLPVFLALVDRDGKFILANESYTSSLDFNKKKITDKNQTEVLIETLIENHKESFEKAQNGEKISFLKQIQFPPGETLTANAKYEPVVNKNGKVESIAICVDDVTPLMEAQDALKLANETKDKLFSIVAHDIKSPLNMFQTFLNVNEETKMSAKEFFQYQRTLQQKLGSLIDTVDELLEWSRMQLEGINAYPENVNINDVVNENISLFDSIIKKKNLDLRVTGLRDISVWIDRNHFKVAIRNLMHNAIKFTNFGGKIEINSQQNDKDTVIRVTDTGVGMKAKTVESIIRKEIQDSQAGTAREMGKGIGLSLSLGLLEKNNCEILVESEVNKGTTFEIKIPNLED